MKLLMKEWKLCIHPTAYIMLMCAALILVPGYPYGVSCFYMGLAIFFVCLTARENHDATYTLMLPVSRADAVKGRILFCTLLEVIDLAVMGLFILIKYAIGNTPNPAGMDAGLALIGSGMIIFAIFNMIFFPVYYKDINKPGKAFGFAAVALCAMLFGPWWAALTAALGDLVGALLFPTGAFFPGFTLTAACTGLIFGLCLYRRSKNLLWPILAALLNTLLVSYLANTAMISYISGSPFVTLLKARAVQLAVMLPVQLVVLGFLSRSSVIKKLLDRAE